MIEKKVTFIFPKCGDRWLNRVPLYRWPPYGLLRLASLTPTDWEIKIIDENTTPINFDEPTGTVALTAMTPLAPRAYQITVDYGRHPRIHSTTRGRTIC